MNTYDANGRTVRRESLNYNYYSIFTYDAIGNVIHGGTYDNNGTVYDSVVQTFERPVREPMNAAPGMPYPIPFINYVISKLKYTYLKEVYEDANGNFVTSYKLDPDKSKLRAGPFHYAVYYKTFDIVSGVSNRQIWRYDNCNCDNDAEEAQLSSSPNSFLPGSNKGPMPFITIPQMKQRIIQLRRQQNK